MNEKTCKFCPTPATYYGFICDKCKPIFQAGERVGKNFVIKELRQRLHEDLRLLDDIEIK